MWFLFFLILGQLILIGLELFILATYIGFLSYLVECCFFKFSIRLPKFLIPIYLYKSLPICSVKLDFFSFFFLSYYSLSLAFSLIFSLSYPSSESLSSFFSLCIVDRLWCNPCFSRIGRVRIFSFLVGVFKGWLFTLLFLISGLS